MKKQYCKDCKKYHYGKRQLGCLACYTKDGRKLHFEHKRKNANM